MEKAIREHHMYLQMIISRRIRMWRKMSVDKLYVSSMTSIQTKIFKCVKTHHCQFSNNNVLHFKISRMYWEEVGNYLKYLKTQMKLDNLNRSCRNGPVPMGNASSVILTTYIRIIVVLQQMYTHIRLCMAVLILYLYLNMSAISVVNFRRCDIYESWWFVKTKQGSMASSISYVHTN